METYTQLWKENSEISDNLWYAWGRVCAAREKLFRSAGIDRRKLSGPQMHFQGVAEISSILHSKLRKKQHNYLFLY